MTMNLNSLTPITLVGLRRETGALLVLAMLAGCNRTEPAVQLAIAAPAPAPVVVVVQRPTLPSEYYVEAEPPPLQREVMVPSPGPGFIYVRGYWGVNGRTHAWVPGRWERPPHERAQWVEPRWERRDRGYILIQGSWR